jgi:predicted Zn-dependent protease
LKRFRPLALANIAQAAIICIAFLGVEPAAPQVGPARNGTAALPNLGDGTDMTPSAERRLGDRIARELYRDPDYIDDAVIMEYVQAICQPLLAAARLRGELQPELDATFAWEVLLGKDRTVNAFALPGAYFGLHMGLVAVVSTRDELASVLAHELSHVTQRHIARVMARQSEQAPWLLGAMILGMLAASKSPAAAQTAIIGGQAVAAQTQLNFSRDMEREADRVGFGVMTQAGFEPQAFVSMFEKLQQASRLNDSGGFAYLRSHPLTTERMSDMQTRTGQTGTAAAPLLTLDHAMVSARARVLANGNVDALRLWEAQAEPTRLAPLPAAAQAGTLYGAVFAAMKLREFPRASAALDRLVRQVQNNVPATRLATLLGAELALARGQPDRAVAALQRAPDAGRAATLLRAQAGVQAGKAAPVTQDLQTWIADHPSDAQAWQLLASAYAAQGKTLSAIRAEAEVNVAQLDYPAALARLKAAQDMARKGVAAGDHIEASIVDTRTRQVELLAREQAVER